MKDNNTNDNNRINGSDFVDAEQFNAYNAPLPDSMRKKKRRKGKKGERFEMPDDTRMPEMSEAERRVRLQRQRRDELAYVRQQELARQQEVREQKRLASLRQAQLEQQQAEQVNAGLQKQNADLNTRIEVLDGRVKELEAELKQAHIDYESLKMAKMIEISDGELDTAKKRLSKLIRDVNKCITLLSE